MLNHGPLVLSRRAGIGLFAALALTACSSSEAPRTFTDGLNIAVAPLTLPSLSDVCYDVRVTNGPDGTGEVVWSQGTPGLNGGTADSGAICSTQYGNGAGADITYIGPCDADGQVDPSDAAGERMNSVTVWFDALYDADGAYLDPAAADGWQNPCPTPEGCTLNVLCEENADALVQFDFTVMRDANQGFFDVAVNFEDIFCSAKLDTCYADDSHIELLHGADLARDWTAVFGFACTAGRGDAQTMMHYGEVEVVCDDGSVFPVDPTAALGNNVSTAPNDSAMRYGIYRGAEALECDDPATSGVVESCNKVYWNLAFDLDDLVTLGATCTLTFSATATDGGAGFANGLPANAGVAYPYIDVDATLTAAGVASCQRNALNDGGAVNTAYHGNITAAGGLAFAPSVMCTQFEGTGAAAVEGAGCGAAQAQFVAEQLSFAAGQGPSGMVAIGGVIFAPFYTNSQGQELWTSDGTVTGTALLGDFNPGPAGADPALFTAMGGVVYFRQNDGVHGVELWKTDGTAAGTVMVTDLRVGSAGSYPTNLRALGDRLIFAAGNATYGDELWITDGTEVGTTLLADIRPGTNSSAPSSLTTFGGAVYFEALDNTHGGELWKTDGTPGGTALFMDINPSGNSAPQNFKVVGDLMYFTADDGVHGHELWRTDGTVGGTAMFADLNPSSDSWSYGHTAVGGSLYFFAYDQNGTWGLWVTDGASVTKLRDDFPASGYAVTTFAGTGRLYFFVTDGGFDYQLWTSDGTVAGTRLLTDAAAGIVGNASGADGAVLGDKFYFQFSDNGVATGSELWETDGTVAGTKLAWESMPGIDGGDPMSFARMGDSVYFNAYFSDGTTTGRHLWRFGPAR